MTRESQLPLYKESTLLPLTVVVRSFKNIIPTTSEFSEVGQGYIWEVNRSHLLLF